ncbi:MAG: DUF2130 domain-containing protein [Rhodocyclaceae bacterium]
MSDAIIICPNCGTKIPVSEALSAQMEKDIEARLHSQAAARLEHAVAEARARARAEADAAAAQRQQEQAAALACLKEELEDQRARARQAQQAELALRREKGALEERARSIDLEVARKLDAQKSALEESLRRSFAEEGSLKLAEREKQIEDLKKLVAEMKRKSEQGSQELQGEVLELDIQAALEHQFQRDDIRPVPRGMNGADIIQEVRNGQGTSCGRIVWETKNTRRWQAGWLAKLKDDLRAAGGNIAVLVSAALPEGMHEFGLVEGVWVASPRAWPALAVALREQLVQVAFAHAAAEGKQEKMEALYRYLAGDQFRARVQGIVEGFTALQDQLARERRAMEKLWKEREKQIERVILNTVGMYGEMRGIAGASLPEIPALTLEGVAGLLEEGEG